MRRLILASFILSIAGLTIGFFLYRQLGQPGAFIKPQTVPVPTDFLTSLVTTDLYANTQGIVTAKSENSMTIKKGSDTLVLSVKESIGLTTFFEKTAQGVKAIKFADIKVGDTVKGGISITLKSSPTRKKDEIIAHALTVTHK